MLSGQGLLTNKYVGGVPAGSRATVSNSPLRPEDLTDGTLQIINQLNKLVEVIEISDLTSDKHVERELVMVRLSTKINSRSDLLEVVSIFRAKVVDVSNEAIIIEATGSTEKMRAFIDMIRPYGIDQLARTGLIALARSNNTSNSQ